VCVQAISWSKLITNYCQPSSKTAKNKNQGVLARVQGVNKKPGMTPRAGRRDGCGRTVGCSEGVC